MTDDLDTILGDHGGLEGLAQELGQSAPVPIEDAEEANENAPAQRVGLLRRLVRAFIASILLTMSFLPAVAKNDTPDTVQTLYEACKAPTSSAAFTTCIAYIEGIADLMTFIGTGIDQYPDIRMFAICSDATYGAAVQAFKNWAEQNPREWQKPKLIGVIIALRTNWDCPQK